MKGARGGESRGGAVHKENVHNYNRVLGGTNRNGVGSRCNFDETEDIMLSGVSHCISQLLINLTNDSRKINLREKAFFGLMVLIHGWLFRCLQTCGWYKRPLGTSEHNSVDMETAAVHICSVCCSCFVSGVWE